MENTETGLTPKKKLGCGKLILIGLAVLVGLMILGAIVGDDEKAKTGTVPAKVQAPDTAARSDEKQPFVAPVEAEEPKDSLTSSQKNAVRSAEQYLSMSGFSRKGLINQLSSGFGDGYDAADATAAVDSLTVDWNEQAARSAQQYLQMSGFSCKGLIQQLSSSYGDNYTVEQATFGAQQAGAC